MELLEFREKILELCNSKEVQEIGDVLLSVVLEHDIDFFEKYENIVDDTKDWLQALWQHYEADRSEKKQDYTPKSLCKLVASLAGEADVIYDCCGGSGALSKAFIEMHGTKNVIVEELDERVIPFLLFNLCLHNINGVVINGNVLSQEKIKCFEIKSSNKYSTCKVLDNFCEEIIADVAISNPPYNIKWEPPLPLNNDLRFPIIPPSSNANYAFVFNCLARTKEKAVIILPNAITNSNDEKNIRQYLIENDLVETVLIMPEKMFEVTSISTCILVLNKHKEHKGEICFIDSRKKCGTEERKQNGQFGGASHTNRTYKKLYNVLNDENIQKIQSAIIDRKNICNFSTIKTNKEVAENDYLLTPSRYIEFWEKEQPHRDFQDIVDNLNYISKMQNSCKLIINETVAKKLGLDIETFKQGKKNSEELKEQMKTLGIDIKVEDYIQFTKNKNEFIFKCNDEEFIPDILIQFLTVWKNQVALLNTMQNQYLSELRDALLPDLMSGKISLTE